MPGLIQFLVSANSEQTKSVSISCSNCRNGAVISPRQNHPHFPRLASALGDMTLEARQAAAASCRGGRAFASEPVAGKLRNLMSVINEAASTGCRRASRNRWCMPGSRRSVKSLHYPSDRRRSRFQPVRCLPGCYLSPCVKSLAESCPRNHSTVRIIAIPVARLKMLTAQIQTQNRQA